MSKLFVPLAKSKAFSVPSRVNSALCWPKATYGPAEVFRSHLMNGLRVGATRHCGAQISACTIMFQAGSRFECDDNLGATHFIRACTLGTGLGSSSFMKMRYVMQHGGYLTVNSDRQNICFTLRCPLPVFPDLKGYLHDMALRCCYLDHEVEDEIANRVREDIATRTPQQRVIDLVQKACWGGPLTNSVYCEKGRIDGMTGEILRDYANQNFTSHRCSIASSGIDFQETLEIAEHFDCGRTERPPEPPPMRPSFPRAGFELDDLGADEDTYIALCVPSCGTCDLMELLRYNILAAACGHANLQEGTHRWDKTVLAPIGGLVCDEFTEFSVFNISYMDAGLFGILAKTRGQTAREVGFAAAKFLFTVNCLSQEQINIGKKRLKLSLALHEGNCVRAAEGLALQLATGYALDNAGDAMAIIDAISPAEVTAVGASISARLLDNAANTMAMMTPPISAQEVSHSPWELDDRRWPWLLWGMLHRPLILENSSVARKA